LIADNNWNRNYIEALSMKWKLGRLGGIGVYVHWSFWILPAWVLFATLSSGGGLPAALSTLVLVAAVFGCVVLHELGHALMARRFGIRTRDIVLYPIGGVARLERIPTRPSQELAIALAGPAVNVAIAGALFLVVVLAGLGGQIALLDLAGGSLLVNLILLNVALALFNLAPAFPMDGGRVLRAFLAMHMPYVKATTIAARLGQIIAIVLVILVATKTISGGLLPLLAVFVFLAAQAELTMVRIRDRWKVHDAAALQRLAIPMAPTSAGNGGIVWTSEVRELPDDERAIRIIVRRS
jgi:Zn-dependent protease